MKLFIQYLHLFIFCGFWRCGIVPEDGGGTMTEEEFRKKAVDGIGELTKETKLVKSQQEKLLENYDQLDKKTKTAMEELTKVKNEQNDVSEFKQSLKRLQVQLRHEQRQAFGDPIARIASCPDRRAALNAHIRKISGRDLDDAQQKAITIDGSLGGTIISDDLGPELYDTLATYGKWSTLGVRSVGKKTTKYPIKTVRPTAKFVRKMTGRKLVDDTDKAGTSLDAAVELIGVLLLIEDELLEDAEVDIVRDVLEDFEEAVNYRLDFMAFMADGTNDELHGAYTGVFEAGTTATAATGNTTIGNLDLDDYLKCLTTVDAKVLERQAKWWQHPQNLARSIAIKDGNGRPIFQTALEAPSFGAIGSILGYPVELIHVGPSTDAAGEKVAAFGDPQAQVVPIRKSIELAQSDDFAFDGVQRAFRAVARAGTGTRRATGFAILTTAAS